MSKFLDEVVDYQINQTPQMLQELIEPENKIPETANTESKTTE